MKESQVVQESFPVRKVFSVRLKGKAKAVEEGERGEETSNAAPHSNVKSDMDVGDR